MKKRVLIFPCGSEIGLELHKSLSFSTHFEPVGGSSLDDHGMFVYREYIGGLPMVDDPDFTQKINEVVEGHGIDYIFPAHDSVVLTLARAQAEGKLACEVVTSPVETCEVARSKSKSYDTFKDVLPVPRVFREPGELTEHDFPVFLKPDAGQGSKGTFVAKSIEDIHFYRAKDPTLLMLEFLPGKEYTVDCFTNGKGDLLYAEGRVRRRISNGISVDSEPVEDGRFGELARRINGKLKLRGVWFFQVKARDEGELVLMEIAPRVAGTMGLTRCRGANLALLSLFDRQGIDVQVFRNDYQLSVDRALQNSYKHDLRYRHVYLDFDDLVVFDGKVNPAVMAFVYQCLNNGISIHLLTKHKEDLHETLKKFRLEGVFDDITWIQDGSHKHEYIKEQDAIFIDDSYAERRMVHDKCGIPVFDSHMLESLVEIF